MVVTWGRKRLGFGGAAIRVGPSPLTSPLTSVITYEEKGLYSPERVELLRLLAVEGLAVQSVNQSLPSFVDVDEMLSRVLKLEAEFRVQQYPLLLRL